MSDDVRGVTAVYHVSYYDEPVGAYFGGCTTPNSIVGYVYFAIASGQNRMYGYCFHPMSPESGASQKSIFDYESPMVTYSFGGFEDDTEAIAFYDVNNDNRMDIVEVNAFGVAKIYYHTEGSSVSGNPNEIPTSNVIQIGALTSDTAKPPRAVALGVASMSYDLSITRSCNDDLSCRVPEGQANYPDIVIHTVAENPGSCAMRCHEAGRMGRDEFTVPRTGWTDIAGEKDAFCYCGPKIDEYKIPL